jgi:hypothetical protein
MMPGIAHVMYHEVRRRTVDIKKLNRDVYHVNSELDNHGMWTEKVASIDVCLVPIGYAYGWQWYGGSGNIHIPRWSLCQFHDFWRDVYTSLKSVLRHEYGHVVADLYPNLVDNKTFEKAFGGKHDDRKSTLVYDEHLYVTEYAATCPSEDFAEVFGLYLKHKGKIPKKFNHKCIAAKWRFVGMLCDKVASAK